MKFLTYNDAIDYLYNKAPLFSRMGKVAYKANLDNTLKLDAYFKHPHKSYKTIHIAGTNGKGSVAHTIAAILMDAGYKTGLYTSPHLKDFRERIKINGLNISEAYILGFLNQYWQLIEDIQPSFFEITTIMAFQYFAENKVDIAVIETGLGGRLDSTNIIEPLLSIITNIGWDHSDLLGNTLEKIAYEKAGIIKKHVPVIIGEHQTPTDAIFQNKAYQEQCDLIFADDEYTIENYFITQNQLLQLSVNKRGRTLYPGLKYQLIGYYQSKNVPTILAAVNYLNKLGFLIQDKNIYHAFRYVVDLTQFRGRWQVIHQQPLTIADIGHNKPALEHNIRQLLRMKKNKLFFVVGFMNDKDIHSILPLFPTDAYYFFTEAPIPRSIKSDVLKQMASNFGLYGQSEPSPGKALTKAIDLAQPNDMVYVGGSTFIVAEVL